MAVIQLLGLTPRNLIPSSPAVWHQTLLCAATVRSGGLQRDGLAVDETRPRALTHLDEPSYLVLCAKRVQARRTSQTSCVSARPWWIGPLPQERIVPLDAVDL